MAGEGPGGRPVEGEVRPPSWAAPAMALLVGAMVVAFTVPVGFGLWPITSWELFSRARTAERTAYRVEVVAADGTVAPLPFDRLGPGHRHWRAIAVRMARSTAAQRAEACGAWASAAVAELGVAAVAEVRVLRVTLRAADRAADRPREVARELVTGCDRP